MVAIVTQIQPQWVAFHIGNTKNNSRPLYSRHFDMGDTYYCLLLPRLQWLSFVGHYCQSTWWPAAYLPWTPSVANPQNTSVFKISPWNDDISLMRIQWTISTVICCRFLESVDSKVSGLRRELEERQVYMCLTTRKYGIWPSPNRNWHWRSEHCM